MNNKLYLKLIAMLAIVGFISTLNASEESFQLETIMLKDIDYGQKGVVYVRIIGSRYKVITTTPLINHNTMKLEDETLDWTPTYSYIIDGWASQMEEVAYGVAHAIPVNEQTTILIILKNGKTVKFIPEINLSSGRYKSYTYDAARALDI